MNKKYESNEKVVSILLPAMQEAVLTYLADHGAVERLGARLQVSIGDAILQAWETLEEAGLIEMDRNGIWRRKR